MKMIKPTMEISRFGAEDVIATSGGFNPNGLFVMNFMQFQTTTNTDDQISVWYPNGQSGTYWRVRPEIGGTTSKGLFPDLYTDYGLTSDIKFLNNGTEFTLGDALDLGNVTFDDEDFAVGFKWDASDKVFKRN